MKHILFLLCCFLTGFVGTAQPFPEQGKQYDVKIFQFISAALDREATSLENLIVYTKPFSKWDIRPYKRSEVWALDTVHRASEVPNFIWGAFSNKFKLTQQQALDAPNRFLNKGVDVENQLSSHLKQNIKKFDEVSVLISNAKNEIFLVQAGLERVDGLFSENEKYWKYVIPADSPFPISDKIDKDTKQRFSESQVKILNLLKELNVYAAKKTANGIFYLADGFTDNSFGFYFSSSGEIEKDNFLFRIMKSEPITRNYFYYVAN